MKGTRDRRERTKRNRTHLLLLLTFCLPLEGRGQAYETPQEWKDHALNPPAIVSTIQGVPVYSFGNVYVYGVSPDLQPGTVIQENNKDQPTKIQPKKSWEMTDNHLGSMVSWQPRTAASDFQPNSAIHLIDGNPTTVWASRAQSRPTVQPAWARLDLPQETTITQIRLFTNRRPGVTHQGWLISTGGWPKQLEIKISRDAWHWDTIYGVEDPLPPAQNGSYCFVLKKPAAAKQIWIVGDNFPGGDCNFSLGEVEVLNDKGNNVALASRGTGVTVSSTNYGGGTRQTYDQMWPIQYDLGVKWMRLSGSNGPYHHDTLSWRFVEQEKGKYYIDPRTDEAITEAAKNGINIVTILSYGNWLYADNPIKDTLDPTNISKPFPPGAITPKSREGFNNYARFMARHFKGRIKYYEIWNEPNSFGFGADEGWMERYCRCFKEVYPVIKAEDPEAKVLFAGIPGCPACRGALDSKSFPGKRPDGWFFGFMKLGVVPLMDGYGWQTQPCSWIPDNTHYISYPQKVKEFQEDMRALGFKGIFIARENLWMAPYPNPLDEQNLPKNIREEDLSIIGMTEIRKAKDMARIFVTNTGLGVAVSNWCNTWLEQSAWHDSGLFRITFAADPPGPQQPQPAYYVMRTLCTLLDQTTPDETLKVKFSNTTAKFTNFNFSLPGNRAYVTLWLGGKSVDIHPGIKTDVLLKKVQATKVVGIDLLNGTEQDLVFMADHEGTRIPGLLVRDIPLFIRVEK